ncbi:MAG: hypothetical protein KDB14_21140 [Planctomycetales bacterium]|nr:hypothetical protein [Planctomycetales bacterium]
MSGNENVELRRQLGHNQHQIATRPRPVTPYAAELGRFLSRDPLGFEGGDTNLYSSVGNAPVNQADPSG